jgi:RNA polymerase sigma factor (sigma-70 family)
MITSISCHLDTGSRKQCSNTMEPAPMSLSYSSYSGGSRQLAVDPVPTDAQLIEASRAGQLDAFGQLVERYQNLVCAVAFSATRDRALSEDVGQETFVAAWTALATIQDPARLKGWLCGTARNLSKMAIRTRKREVVDGDEATSFASTDASALDGLLDHERATAVRKALEDISEPYRETLVLYYREDKSIAQVADGLGISEDAVKQRLSRGRQSLKGHVVELLESALASSKPRKAFATGVLALIGARVAVGTAAAATAAPTKATAASAPTAWKGIVLAALVGIVGVIVVVTVVLRGRGIDDDHRGAGERQASASGAMATSVALRPGPRGAPPAGAPPIPVETLEQVDRSLDPTRPRVIVEVTDILGGPIEGAEIFENDALVGRTDARGLLSISSEPTEVSGLRGFRVRASGYANERATYSGYGRVTISMIPESTISGTVMVAGTTTPLPGVRVFARGLDTVTTDAAGRFMIERVPPGHFELVVGGNGWSSRSRTPVDVGLHMNQTDIALHADRGFTVEGRLVAAAGSLPANLEIMGGPSTVAVEPNGRFRIEGVPPGIYHLALKNRDTAYASGELTVTDHDVKDFEIKLGSLTSIDVIVDYADGTPVPRVDVAGQLEHDRSSSTFSCKTDDHGRCQLTGLVAGELKRLRPRLAGVAPRNVVVPSPEPIRFTIAKLGSITGTVTTAANEALPFRIITCTSTADKASKETIISDAKGRFQVGGLTPGSYAIDVFPYDNHSFAAYLTDMTKQPIGTVTATVTDGQVVTDVRILTTLVEGTLAGVVTSSDGQPVPGALVTYAPENPNLTLSGAFVGEHVVATDNRGRFEFARVDASRAYELRAQGPNGEQAQQKQVRAGTAVTLTIRQVDLRP